MKRLAVGVLLAIVLLSAWRYRRATAAQRLADHAFPGIRNTVGVVYGPEDPDAATLDVHVAPGAPRPTVVFYHGGGWTQGSSGGYKNVTGQFLAHGFNVVSVNYRLAPAHPAPAAVADAGCALRWVADHGAEYGLRADTVLVAGTSAGSTLALLVGLDGAQLPRRADCPSAAPPAVRAIVNLWGIDDVGALALGPGARPWARAFVGMRADSLAVARAVSPLAHISPTAPPVVTVHGTADPEVPYAQAVELQDSLAAHDVRHALVTIPGGAHGLQDAQWPVAWAGITAILAGR